MPDTYLDHPDDPDLCPVCGDPRTGPGSGVVTAAASTTGIVLLHKRCADLIQSLSEDAVRLYTRRARVAAATRMIGRPVPPSS